MTFALHTHVVFMERPARGMALLTGLLPVVGRWHARARERRALAQLDDRMLRDIGISRTEAERECAKPFWC